MSNPARAIKKNFKKIVVVAAIAAIAVVALPALAAAAGSVASAAGATTAATAGAATAAGTGAAAAGAAGGGGLLASAGGLLAKGGAMAGGLLAKGGAAVAGASPLVKLGLINAGSTFAQGALTPDPQTAAEQQAELQALQHSQVFTPRDYNVGGGNQMQVATAPQAGAAQYAPAQQSRGLIGQYNQQTGQWERG